MPLSSWILLAAGFTCAVGPTLLSVVGLDGLSVRLEDRLLPPMTGAHLLGTDELGRDVMVRVLLGGQVSLQVSLLAALLTGLLGGSVGLVAGAVGGKVDAWVMGVTGAFMTLPALPLMLLLSVASSGSGRFVDVMPASVRLPLLISLVGWTGVARLVRALAKEQQALPYVLAARSMGASTEQLLFRFILPCVLPALGTALALEASAALVLESSLSFLGLGVRPPSPSWGSMLLSAPELLGTAPWLMWTPGVCIGVTVLLLNRLADALRHTDAAVKMADAPR